MSYTDIQRIIEQAAEQLIAAGVTRSVVETELSNAEAMFVRDVAEAKKDRQFLLELRTIGTQAMAERKGKSDRTIREWRADAIARETERKVGTKVAA